MKYYVLVEKEVFNNKGNKFSDHLDDNLVFPDFILSKREYITKMPKL